MPEKTKREDTEHNDNKKGGFPSQKLKDIITILQSIVTIVAIIGAFIWFLWTKETSQRANINHEITHRQVHGKWNWVRASITIDNIGKIPIDLSSAIIRIQKILPLDDSLNERINRNEHLIFKGDLIVDWPMIEDPYKIDLKHKINPGEKDNVDVEFMIPSYIKTVKIYCYFERETSPPFGWSKSTIYDLKRIRR